MDPQVLVSSIPNWVFQSGKTIRWREDFAPTCTLRVWSAGSNQGETPVVGLQDARRLGAATESIMSTSVYEKIKTSHKLPSPTGVALQILKLSQDDESGIEEIAAVIESDPAIASRLLKLVNSSLAGMPRQIASISRAAALVGTRAVTDLALAFSLVSQYSRGYCVAFNYELFWSDSLGRAVASRHLAHRVKIFPPDEAFACGLISQIGRLALATAFPVEYTEVLNRVTADSSDEQAQLELTELESAAFDIGHDELTAEMMRDWHIPAIFCDAVRAQLTPDGGGFGFDSRTRMFVRILHLSGVMSAIFSRPRVYRDSLSRLLCEANNLNINPQILHETFDAVSHEWRETGEIFSIQTRPVPSLAELYSQAQEHRKTLNKQPGDRLYELSGEIEGA